MLIFIALLNFVLWHTHKHTLATTFHCGQTIGTFFLCRECPFLTIPKIQQKGPHLKMPRTYPMPRACAVLRVHKSGHQGPQGQGQKQKQGHERESRICLLLTLTGLEIGKWTLSIPRK